MMAHLQRYLDPVSPQQHKKVIKFGPPLTQLSGSAHGRAQRLAVENRIAKNIPQSINWMF